MSNLIYRAYHDSGLDILVCRIRGHRWQAAGWRAKTCTRCPKFEMWWEL